MECWVSDPRFAKNAHYLHTIRKLMRTTVDLDDYFQFVTRVYHSFCFSVLGTMAQEYDIGYRCPIGTFLVTIRISTMTNEIDYMQCIQYHPYYLE